MTFDPAKPLQVMVSIDSPQFVTFAMWYRRPTDPNWTSFAGGKDDNSATSSAHSYVINAQANDLPVGTMLHYFFHFLGNPNSPYKATISLLQGQVSIDTPSPLSGVTDGKGLARVDQEVRLS